MFAFFDVLEVQEASKNLPGPHGSILPEYQPNRSHGDPFPKIPFFWHAFLPDFLFTFRVFGLRRGNQHRSKIDPQIDPGTLLETLGGQRCPPGSKKPPRESPREAKGSPNDPRNLPKS